MAKDNSIYLLYIIILSLITAFASAMSTRQVARKTPHVILIVADDLGWNDVPWNNPNVYAPKMNNLAMNGVILNQSYVQPTCTPTRAALMTGRYPFVLGLQQGVIGPLEPMGVPLAHKFLPKYLRKAGYTTHAIGKWHLGFCSWDYTPLKRGFDSFYGFYTGSADYYSHKRRASRSDRVKKKDKLRKGKKKKDIEFLDLRNNTIVDDEKGGIYSTYLFASAAEDIIRNRKKKDPMFMYLAFQSVHSPLQVPRQYMTHYRHIKYYERRVYLGMVTAMDEAIGRVVKALKDTGHYENSVIIFTTDNGGAFTKGASNYPLRGGKASLWEGGTRGPAFIHSPLLPNPGQVNEGLVHTTDWFSTIASIAGVDIPKVDGVNQWDSLAGVDSLPPRNNMIYNMDDSQKFKAGVRMDNYKLLVGGMAQKAWVSLPEYEDENPRGVNSKKKKKNKQKGSNTLKLIQQLQKSLASPLRVNGRETDLTWHNPEKREVGEDTQELLEESSLENHNDSLYLLPSSIQQDYLPDHDIIVEDSRIEFHNDSFNPIQVRTSTDNESRIVVLNDSIEPKQNRSSLGGESKTVGQIDIAFVNSNCGMKAKLKRWAARYSGEYILWKNLKRHPCIEWPNRVINILGGYFRDRTKIRLFNLEDDPEERTNLSVSETNRTLSMLSFLAEELLRYNVPLIRKDSPRGDPSHWKGIWTPGWCRAY